MLNNERRLSELARRCLEALRSADRGFAKSVENFSYRPQQAEMMRCVAQAIDNKEDLIVEAGTGTGKTLAYLIPALLSGKKTVVSTGTRYLQDQIYTKDLPLVMDTLGAPAEIALLKGRSNYLCLERFDELYSNPQQELELSHADDLPALRQWVRRTANGDISDFSLWSEDSHQWGGLTTTAESCLGNRCSFFDRCFVNKARRRALAADLVVINHHLLLADMVLKEEGFGKLLPNTEVVIVDEAHQLRDVGENFFAIGFSSHQLGNLYRDLHKEEACKETFPLMQACEALQGLGSNLASAMQAHVRYESIAVLKEDSNFVKAQEKMREGLDALCEAIEPVREYNERLQNLHTRASALQKDFSLIFDEQSDWISWYKHQNNRFQFHASPLWASSMLADKKELSDACWIYTSATLSVAEDFSYFCGGLGLRTEEQKTVSLSSPFDHAKQAALYLPAGLPDPNTEHYLDRLVDASIPLLEVVQGGVFFLVTSHRALGILTESLKPRFPQLLAQGDAPKIDLIKRFSKTPHAILLATSGFWEGVDVRGSNLRCVIIDRLPFASPADPVIRGRMRSVQQNGGNYFVEYSLPEAIISLRQGVGRLIRDENDKGVVMIGDSRLQTRSYGRVFLKSLPPMSIHKDFESLRPYLLQPLS